MLCYCLEVEILGERGGGRERERSEDWDTFAKIKENKCVIVNLRKTLKEK